MKQQIIGVTELQRQFRVVFDKVAKKGVPFILTRGSRPEAVLISYEEYLRYQALNEPDEEKRFDLLMKRMQVLNENVSDDELKADIEAAVREVRAKRRSQKKSN
ncbi:MAG: type II toxin-antitoxin system Phd/YefM family antitoxin [Chloroflexi bacterium]|nr:type II toxin-antitoxin system Phd/YefM family antitoxin [Chloroflexota bacterium]